MIFSAERNGRRKREGQIQAFAERKGSRIGEKKKALIFEGKGKRRESALHHPGKGKKNQKRSA